MGTRSVNTICRLCLRESQFFTNIFEVNVNRSFVLAVVIADLLQFPVLPNDGYPQNVCSRCADKLTDFALFKDQCRESKDTYDNFFLRKNSCEEQHEMPEPPVTYIKTEPIDLPDEEEEEIHADATPDLAVKEEEINVNTEEEKSPPRWECDDSCYDSCEVSKESMILKDDEMEGERSIEDSSSVPNHPFETRIIHVQSLTQGNYANINYCYPMEMWQPIAETADERRRRLARERSRKVRANLTPDQVVQRRRLNTQRTALRRQNETPEQRERRRRLDAYRTAMRRMRESPEEKAERRRLDKMRHAWRRRKPHTLNTHFV